MSPDVTSPNVTSPNAMSSDAASLRELFGGPRPVVLPSAWDAGSARAARRAGAAAIAVHGPAVAWSLGHVDGEPAPYAQLVAACERIRAAVDVPVMIDLSATSSVPAEQRRDAMRALMEIGVAGLTIADDEHAIDLLARRDDAPAFIEVRLTAASRARIDETAQRAQSFVTAGADGVLLPSREMPTVVRVAREIRAPVSVDAGDGWAPPVSGLARIGVRGIRLGDGPFRIARGLIAAVTTEALHRGTYALLSRTLGDTRETR